MKTAEVTIPCDHELTENEVIGLKQTIEFLTGSEIVSYQTFKDRIVLTCTVPPPFIDPGT